jgi:antagonist of KipI
LHKDFRLEFNAASLQSTVAGRRVSNNLIPKYSSFPTVRIIAGAESDLLSDKDRKMLVGETFLISNDSNRMGFRLSGSGFHSAQTAEMVSSAVTFGTIQLLPNGQLIVLMADHQTSGGYPRIASVISADRALLGQLGANDNVAFKLVDIDEAERAALQSELDIRRLRIGCQFGRYW